VAWQDAPSPDLAVLLCSGWAAAADISITPFSEKAFFMVQNVFDS